MKKIYLFFASFFLFLIFAAAANAAVFTVTKANNTNDGVCDADCSLREALTAADASADSANVIVFSRSLSDTPIQMPGQVILSGNLVILGFGADHLSIIGGSGFRGGSGSGGIALAGIKLANSLSTAITMISGDFTFDGVFFYRDNSVGGRGGAISSISEGVVNIRNSSFLENIAPNGSAINIDKCGTFNISNSTFDNQPLPFPVPTIPHVPENDIYYRDCHLTIRNSTISILDSASSTSLGNSIVWKMSGGNLITSEGNNIVSSFIGTPMLMRPTDMAGVDPLLGPFQFNGGKVPTSALLPGSPGVDAGSNSLAAGLPLDQRGFFRVVDGNGDSNAVVDIGAFEYLSTDPGAAAVSISGQVVSATGLPYFRASVTVIDTYGIARQGLTNSFGFYTVAGLPSDEYCAVIVSAKKGRFKIQAVNSGQGVSGMNFTSN
jgi:CSLREA domain-containing protein